MSTSKTCGRCGRQVQMTRMSMIDYEDLCYPCRRKEDEEIEKEKEDEDHD